MIKYKGRTIVCDSGVHPAFSGMAALPFLDELDWSTVDAILITHFHLDHAASLTYVMEKVRSRESFVGSWEEGELTLGSSCPRADQLQGGQGSRVHVAPYQGCLPIPHERFRAREVRPLPAAARSPSAPLTPTPTARQERTTSSSPRRR